MIKAAGICKKKKTATKEFGCLSLLIVVSPLALLNDRRRLGPNGHAFLDGFESSGMLMCPNVPAFEVETLSHKFTYQVGQNGHLRTNACFLIPPHAPFYPFMIPALNASEAS